MSRARRRIKIYLIIFVILLGVAAFLPAIMRTISDYFHTEQSYYYPNDLQRDDYLKDRENK
jgi:hypothetical protein